MSKINVTNLTFSYPGSANYVFENTSFCVDSSWKLGFIARNGKGKTTLFNLFLKKYEYGGEIFSSLIFDKFPYEVGEENLKKPFCEFYFYLKEECEFWRLEMELNKLKCDSELLYRPFNSLSHGERTKLMLALLFSGENDFLLIDEPTNHLDSSARIAVREYLNGKSGFILVSHDRELLDGCVDHVLAINKKSIQVQKGNFSSWWENKQREDSFSLSENEKHEREIKRLSGAMERLNSWADKSERSKIGNKGKREGTTKGARAYIGEKTRKMESLKKNAESRILREIRENEDMLADIESSSPLKLNPLKINGKNLVFAKEFYVGYEEGNYALKNFNFAIKSGERIFIRGKNGSGKTTFIKAVLNRFGGEYELFEKGDMFVLGGIKISYINQDTSFLKGTIRDYCIENGLDESLFCAVLNKLYINKSQFNTDMSRFSEGQKKKILIAGSLLKEAHLYIWDEPLNYIDVFSRIQIERLIAEYSPTMLVVEHDNEFLKNIATGVVDIE